MIWEESLQAGKSMSSSKRTCGADLPLSLNGGRIFDINATNVSAYHWFDIGI